jgi:hypothetical protein
LAGRAISAALDESADPLKAGHLALKVIEAADPRDQATLTVSAEQQVENMSLAELMAFAEANGITVPTPPATPPEALEAPS